MGGHGASAIAQSTDTNAAAEVQSAKVVVQSIGTASFSIVAALRHISTLTEQELAERLFRAPAELFSDVPRDTAEKAAAILREAGLDVAVMEPNATFSAGGGDHDIAVMPTDMSRMGEIIQEVARFLGVDAKTAKRIICAAPSILVGGVSAATVEALHRRFDSLGVELSISRPAESIFDLVAVQCAPSVRLRIIETLRAAGAPVVEGGDPKAETPLVAAGLDRKTAGEIWDKFGRKNASLRILDRAFERFDIRLDQCPHTASAELANITGMPEKAAIKVLERLPIIVQQGLTYEQAKDSLSRLAAIGAKATDELATLQTFSVMIETAPDRRNTAQKLVAILDYTADQANAVLRALPAQINGPLTATLARWLLWELKSIGTVARRVKR